MSVPPEKDQITDAITIIVTEITIVKEGTGAATEEIADQDLLLIHLNILKEETISTETETETDHVSLTESIDNQSKSNTFYIFIIIQGTLLC